MENIRKYFAQFLSKHDEDFKIVSWAESSGWHRCSDPEGKDHYRFKIIDEASFVFMDWRSKCKTIVNIDNMDVSASIAKHGYHKHPAIDKEKLFNENYPTFLNKPESKEPFKIWEDKGLKPFNTKTIINYGKQELLVPYEDIKTGKIVGCQRRLDGSTKDKMKCVRGTQPNNSIHIIQKSDQIDPGLNKVLGIITEGVSTGSEIAEAIPNAFVVCGTGINNIIDVYDKLVDKYKSVTWVIAIDKDKAGNQNKQLKAVVDNMKQRKIPFIQPDENDSNIRELTDFNDMAIKLGKSKIHRLILSYINIAAPYYPQIINVSDKGYLVEHPSRDITVNIPIGDTHKIRNMFTPAGLERFKQEQGVTDNTSASAFRSLLENWVLKQAADKKQQDKNGLGIYQEDNNFVLNSSNGRVINYEKRGLMINHHPKPVSYTHLTLPTILLV